MHWLKGMAVGLYCIVLYCIVLYCIGIAQTFSEYFTGRLLDDAHVFIILKEILVSSLLVQIVHICIWSTMYCKLM